MTAHRDLLELDDAEFDARMHAVKQRLPMDFLPRVYETREYNDTLPSDHVALDAAHAASEITDDVPSTAERIESWVLRWLTPGRFWSVYGMLILGSLLGVWWLAA